MEPIKVVTILGTRPEVIRLSRAISLLDRNVNHILVHTGQNYTKELNDIFFSDLNIRKPDYEFKINTSSFGRSISDVIVNTERVLNTEKPDAVLILGDTNSSLSAIISKRMAIPVYHAEAGNRCFDENVPEEINRRIIDHVSDFNLVYTDRAMKNLVREGLPLNRIYIIGSPMREVLEFYKEKILNSRILTQMGLSSNKYFVASFHREENVDNPKNLSQIILIINSIANLYGVPVIVSTHPHTCKSLQNIEYACGKNIIFSKPFSFTDYIKLQSESICVISDSGTISEESAIANFPAITIRSSIERQEAIDTGSIFITGLNERVIHSAIKFSINKNVTCLPPEYSVINTSERIFKIIIGTCKLSNDWYGINKR